MGFCVIISSKRLSNSLYQRGKGLSECDRWWAQREMVLEGTSCCMEDLINELEQIENVSFFC